MSKRGVYAVLVGSMSINTLLVLDQPSYLFNCSVLSLTAFLVNVSTGLAFLFFPLIGLLADVCFTRYQVMKTSFAILSTTGIFFSHSLVRYTCRSCVRCDLAQKHLKLCSGY